MKTIVQELIELTTLASKVKPTMDRLLYEKLSKLSDSMDNHNSKLLIWSSAQSRVIPEPYTGYDMDILISTGLQIGGGLLYDCSIIQNYSPIGLEFLVAIHNSDLDISRYESEEELDYFLEELARLQQ